jgi:beta-glucosidase
MNRTDSARPVVSRPFAAFPPGFLWGVATAAYQIEGAAAADGRTPSVWDTFCRRPGATAMDHNGDRACDHYHLFKRDVALMKDLGIKAYRFSSSWSRVIPERGRVNAKGLDFYRRLVDELLGAGIEPWMTLFHWDMPQWCEDAYGGWESRTCSEDFADYATVMAKAVGDRVAGFMTINEFFCFLDKGLQPCAEVFAPGKQLSLKAFNQSRHHAALGHGLAVQALRGVSAAPVGLAENIPNVVPVTESADDISAAGQALRELTGMYLTPILEGKYHPAYLESAGANAPVFTDADMRVISSKLDFVGVNLYAPTYVRADASTPKGWSILPCDESYPKMHMPWLNIGPAILYWAPRLLSELWNVPAVYITENGCANPDRPNERGEINDIGRVMFLQNHLLHAQRATAEGYPLKGYFLWSLMDNFEWAFGYTKRFGIVYVNFETMERTPKLSARFYSSVIARNAVGG